MGHISNGRDKRPDSSISIVVLAEEFNSYLFTITSNEKQFPKAMRYTLSNDIRNTSLRVCKLVYRGCSLKLTSLKDYRKLRDIQDELYDALVDLKCLLHIATDVASPKNPLQIATLYDGVIDSFTKWVKNTKRLMKRVEYKESTTAEERRMAHIKTVEKLAREMDHDDSGFILLKRKAA